MLIRSKAIRKIQYRELKEIDIKLRKNDKKVKASNKSLKHNKRYLKQLWKEHKSEIKLINYIEDNKQIIKMVYGKEEVEAINLCVEALQKDRYLPFNISTEYLYSEIKKSIEQNIRGHIKPQLSISKLADEKGITTLEAIKEENKEYEEKDSENHTKTSEKEDKKENSNEDKSQVEERDNEKGSKDEKLNKRVNKFREEMGKNSIFAKTSIDRKGIINIQKRLKDEKLKTLSPEDFIAFLGYMESQANANKEVNYEKFLKTISEDSTKVDNKKLYSKHAIKSLEEMIAKSGQMKKEEIVEMSKEEKFMYNIAKEYKRIKEKEQKEQGQKQEQDLEVV